MPKLRIKHLLWLVLFYPFIAFAAQTGEDQFVSEVSLILNEPINQSTKLGRYVYIYEDKTAQLDFKQVVEKAEAGLFMSSVEDDLGLGVTSSVWWVKVSLENRSDNSQNLVLTQSYSLIDKLDLWEVNGQQVVHKQSGDSFPFQQREIQHNSLSFQVDLPANSTKTLYLRYQSSGSISINLAISDTISFAEETGFTLLLQGVFYGAIIALALYNLFIFLIVRDLSYFLYILYLVSLGLFISGFNGLSAQYLWPNSPVWGNDSLLVFWATTVATALVFSQYFLNIKQFSPRVNLLANVFVVIAIICAISAFFLPYSSVIKVLFVLAPLVYLLILFAGFKGVKRGYKPANYFLTAWALLMMAAITSTLISAGLIQGAAAISPYIIQFGAVIEVVLLSIALASRISALEQESLTDPLTKLFNRRFFDRQLESTHLHAKKYHADFSLMLIDVDHFKKFNDEFGHETGDVLLKELAMNLEKYARSGDYVCRYGGEEFAVILPETSASTAVEIAERMRLTTQELIIQQHSVTISIGISTWQAKNDIDMTTLFQQADQSLYLAKSNGRNCIEEHVSIEAS